MTPDSFMPSHFFSGAPQIREWLKYVGIKNAHINPETLVVDTGGEVDITRLDLAFFPVQFGYVGGDFLCQRNALQSLKGAPSQVEGDFNCMGNELKSLEFGPFFVGRHYFCQENELSSLEFCPKKIKGKFNCSSNVLTSLAHGPEIVEDSYFFSKNQVSNFLGAPQKVGFLFCGLQNPIESLYDLDTDIGIGLMLSNEGKIIHMVQQYYDADNRLRIEAKDLIEIQKIIKEEKMLTFKLPLLHNATHIHKI